MNSESNSRVKVENTKLRIDPWYLLDSGDLHAVQVSMKWNILLVNIPLMDVIGMQIGKILDWIKT